MRNLSLGFMVLAVAGIVLGGATTTVNATEIKQGVGVREWIANYTYYNSGSDVNPGFNVNEGWAPMNMLYYDLSIDKVWKFGLMGGFGAGWSEENQLGKIDGTPVQMNVKSRRTDIQASFGRVVGPVTLGLNYHYVGIWDDVDYYFGKEHLGDDGYTALTHRHGPEMFIGSGIGLVDKLSLYGSFTYSPYMMTYYRQTDPYGDTSDMNDHTVAFAVDGGFSYALSEKLSASAGYRYLQFNETSKFVLDRFHGPYIEIGGKW